MPLYVDGFVLPIQADKLAEYQAIASKASEVWKEHGALEYRECVLEDAECSEMTPFPTLAGTKDGETVVLAYIVYESREQRDAVNAKVMADPRMQEMCPAANGKEVSFDFKRMAYGGFRTIVGN